MTSNVTVTTTAIVMHSERRSKRPSTRPALQIYRPPGLRGNDENSANTKPNQTAGAKQLKKETVKKQSEENNNYNTMESGKCANTLNGCTRKSTDNNNLLNDIAITGGAQAVISLQRSDSALSGESIASSQVMTITAATEGGGGGKGGGGGGGGGGNSDNGFNNISSRKSIIISKEQQQQNANKKKQLNGKEIEELAIGLRKLNLTKENSLVEQFITSNFEDDEIGGAVGQMLVHFSIEENRQAGKAVARIAAQLLNFDTANVFHQGITVALMHYFECRDRLRIDHFRVWITFLNFVSDLYASVGYIYEGELVDLVFRIFGYLLKAPILDTLKIEELESLIGCLLSVGYDLERQCPEQLAILKDLIRDAFIEVQEPWARKMILLLMELGASGWKLPPEANEYYFQHTSS
uniref:MIF4G domain-containing protein n=1 Tax=Wuchereria bancrofti TaxID=6293 RepID=A0A1I8EXQ0_WUCBA